MRQFLVGHLLVIHVILPDELHRPGKDRDVRIARIVLLLRSHGLVNAHADHDVKNHEDHDETLQKPLFHGPKASTHRGLVYVREGVV